MLNKRADKLELLRIAEAVALEKSIDKELIISSMEKQEPSKTSKSKMMEQKRRAKKRANEDTKIGLDTETMHTKCKEKERKKTHCHTRRI